MPRATKKTEVGLWGKTKRQVLRHLKVEAVQKFQSCQYLSDCKHNCNPIFIDDNAWFTIVSIETLIWSNMIPSSLWRKKCLFLWISLLFLKSKKCPTVTFAEKPQMKIINLMEQKPAYLVHTWSDNAFKGTLVNRTLVFLQGGHLNSGLYSPLNKN